MKALKSPRSRAAWTRPRWRDGSPSRRSARHGAEKGRAAVLEGRGDDGAVAIAGDAVEDDAGNDDAGAVAWRSLATRAAIDWHWCAASTTSTTGRPSIRGKIGGRAAAAGRAVEQAHDAFDEHEIGVIRLRRELAREALRPHRPGIEIEAGPAGRGLVEARIDIVGADLGARRPAGRDCSRRAGARSVTTVLPRAGGRRAQSRGRQPIAFSRRPCLVPVEDRRAIRRRGRPRRSPGVGGHRRCEKCLDLARASFRDTVWSGSVALEMMVTGSSRSRPPAIRARGDLGADASPPCT